MFIIYCRLVVRAVSTELMEELCGGGGNTTTCNFFCSQTLEGRDLLGELDRWNSIITSDTYTDVRRQVDWL